MFLLLLVQSKTVTVFHVVGLVFVSKYKCMDTHVPSPMSSPIGLALSLISR